MKDFESGDIIEYKKGSKSGVACVLNVSKQKLYIQDLNDWDEFAVLKSNAKLLPMIELDKDCYSKFARYEITLQDVTQDGIWQRIVNKDNYQITIEDMVCVLKKLMKENITADDFFDRWDCYFGSVLTNIHYENQDNVYYNRNHVLQTVNDNLFYWLICGSDFNTGDLIDEIEIFLEDEKKPLRERRFPDSSKKILLKTFENNRLLDNASEDELSLYKRFAEEMYKRGDIDGLLALGYGCYGGNRVFECDWKKSEECMLKLMDLVKTMPEQAYYANTLGYIYYYGRITGIPEYEKAYKYFSFAAFSGVYEAKYKVADMYKNGYGVQKSKEVAQNIVSELYCENLKLLENGEFNTKLADIAFRMGDYKKDDSDIYESEFESMLYYYYQARFAIKMRMLTTDYYGDKSFANAIEKALDEAKALINFEPRNKVNYYSIDFLFTDYFASGAKLDVKATNMSYGKTKLTFKPHKGHGRNSGKRLFLTIPELDMCGFYDSLTVTVVSDGGVLFVGDEDTNTVVVDRADADNFYYDEISTICFYNCMFEIKKPKKSEKTHRFVSVCFLPNKKCYDYLCDDENVKIGDKLMLKTQQGEKQVTVVNIFEKTESETALPIEKYKRI